MPEGLPDGEQPDVQILAVEFADNYEVLEITIIERRHVAPLSYKREVITVDASLLVRSEIDDIVDSLKDMVDAGLRHIREKGGE